MNITIENKKAKAIELMKKLEIYKPYIKGFEKDNTVCFYENFGGFWAWQEPELMEKIKAFEEKHNCLVYAVTHEYTEFGECYDFLYIRIPQTILQPPKAIQTTIRIRRRKKKYKRLCKLLPKKNRNK